MAFAPSLGSTVHMLGRVCYIAAILLISFFILRAKRIGRLIKATYLTMPLMIVFIMLGIFLYGYAKWVPIAAGAAIVVAVVYYCFSKKLSWQYYFATAYTGLAALYVVLSGMDI